MTMASNKDKVRRLLQEVWSAGQVETIDELVSPDYRGDIPLVGQVDRAGLKATVGAFRRAFPDLSFELQDVLGEGDKVATRWTAHGTSQGEFMGLPASHQRTTVSGFTLSEFHGGKIASDSTEYDVVAFLQSLGVQVPTPGQGAQGGEGRAGREP
jgi:steroid delta-isomerase-like uncharacterized protein